MRSNIKYLSVGLVIGLVAACLLLAGMLLPSTVAANLATGTPTLMATPTIYSTSTQQLTKTTRTPTSTYTFTPTLIRPTLTATETSTPTVTSTVPSPTPTLSGTMLDLLESGYLVETGPLILRRLLRLYDTSIKYIRQTSEESRILGEEINGKGYGSPTDICGPLSIAILQEAGLVDSGLDPHRFWLLNPDVWDDRRLLDKAFPPERFENIRHQIKLNKVDWNETPLKPGDFVYIYAGTGGNFEHMLVVNRIDANGRAYAVTNHKTENGFVISEVLLYDPSNLYVGMFPVWTARPNAETGSTGFAGFEIWRMKSP